MALDPTARRTNFKDSVRKFFIDNVRSVGGLQVTFDKGFGVPKVQGTEVDKWVSVNFGDIELKTLTRSELRVYCCSRNDSEGFKLAQTRDTVVEHLTDADKTDTMKRINLYKTTPSSWTVIGTMVISNIMDMGEGELEDGTKFLLLNVTIMWPSVI